MVVMIIMAIIGKVTRQRREKGEMERGGERDGEMKRGDKRGRCAPC